MDWNAIKIFMAIANTRSLVTAATELGMSHTTVYRRLNEFEEQVGRLFERLNGAYELTEMGEEMFTHAQRIAHSFEDIERDLVGKDTQLTGIVKITAPSSFSYIDLPLYLTEFNKLYPDIKIELSVTNLPLNMTNRRADIAIRLTSAPPEHLVGLEIRRIKWGVYASQNYIDSYGRANSFSDLEKHNLIGASGSLRSHPTYSLLDKKLSSNISLRTDDFYAMSRLAQSGQGLAILPDELQQADLERLFTFEQAKENQLWILTHPDLRKVERIKIVMRFLAESFADSHRF